MYSNKMVVILSSLIMVTGYWWGAKAESSKFLDVKATSFSFDRNNPKRKKFGRLHWRGGLVLTSEDNRFGGLSGLMIEQGGQKILGVTDRGNWLTAQLTYSNSQLNGFTSVKMGPLLNQNKTRFSVLIGRDAESITVKDGFYVIGFERNHRVGYFHAKNGRPGYLSHSVPWNQIKAMGLNKGLESIEVLSDGSLIAFAELLETEDGYLKGWLVKEGVRNEIYLKAIDGFSITGMAVAGEGDLFILERRYRRGEGVKMRVRLIKLKEIKPGAKFKGEILFEGGSDDYVVDNMEGLAVHKNSQGNTILTLVSDDNFSSRQKTLIMQFELQ